ncbi:hypothetical protein [Nocardioides ferulae]|uniref:hypothetical protein n=1 Tax=Nocardioides ferulae TaxID=2340821 RepID=UPI000EB0672D|nr:hypothetical protein [Nocardioides ferulae]
MTRTEIRDALTAVHDAVEVRPVDQVAFQARVRRARRQRVAGRVALAVGAAAAVAVTAVVVPQVTEEVGADARLPADRREAADTNPLTATQWFVLDHGLTALDPGGTVHRLPIRVESVAGWDEEHVYATGAEGEMVVVEHWVDDDGRFGQQREEPPSGGADGSLVRSDDGRYVAWVADGQAVVRDNDGDIDHDVTPGTEQRFPVDANTALVDVGAEGVLLSEDGDLKLRDGEQVLGLPTTGDGYGVAAQLAGGRVLVPDRDGRSRLYDVTGGQARLLATVDGMGYLSPDGDRIAIVSQGGLAIWQDGRATPVGDLGAGAVEPVRWAAGADSGAALLVSTASDGLLTCEVAALRCTRLPVEGDVGLG